MEDAAAAKLRANLKRIKGKLTDVNQLISQFSQVKQEKLTLQGEVATVQEEVATLRQEKQAFQERLDALQRALEAQSAGAVMQQRNDALEADNRKLKADLTSELRKNKDLEAENECLRDKVEHLAAGGGAGMGGGMGMATVMGNSNLLEEELNKWKKRALALHALHLVARTAQFLLHVLVLHAFQSQLAVLHRAIDGGDAVRVFRVDVRAAAKQKFGAPPPTQRARQVE